jgi:hypothetical protein
MIAKPALLASSVVLPLMILEAVNTTLTRQHAQGFVVLFGTLWVIALVFFILAMRSWRAARGGYLFSRPVTSLLGAVVMVTLALIWTSIVADQFPCFMGVPNCD